MSEIQERIDRILSADNPVNVNGEIEDLKDYVKIFSDGRWGHSGFSYYYNEKTHSLIMYSWDNWQPPTSGYEKATIEDYVGRMMNATDDNHFQRYIDGFKKIFK